MDIQKVKELALANGFKLKEQASGNMDLNAYVYDFANAVEREAKAQSDQKIKLLLCDEHLKKCESPTGIFNSQYPDEEPCLICLAKQAKAQAVPDLGELQERIAGHQYYHDEHGHMIVDMDDVVKEISGFDSWKAQAVPAQLDVNSILHDIDCYFDNGLSNTERTANNLLQSIYEKLSGEVKAQEPAND